LSYVSRILRLTLLAPAIVEAILDGRQPTEMTLAMLMEPFPPSWAGWARRPPTTRFALLPPHFQFGFCCARHSHAGARIDEHGFQ
jgi:hypothetical protein